MAEEGERRKFLQDNYVRIHKRLKLYKKATSTGKSISGFGTIIFFLSIVPVIPSILEIFFNIELAVSLLWGMIFGFLLIMVGQKINRRVKIPGLLIEEESFLKIFDLLGEIETYMEQDIEYSRMEAKRKLQKIVRNIEEPRWGIESLWKAYTKEVNKEIRILKKNLNVMILPSLERGNKEEIRKVYNILGMIAMHLLNPTFLGLKDLNKSMSELPSFPQEKVPQEKAPVIPFLARHPRIRHIFFLMGTLICSYLAFYIGVNFLRTSIDTSYIVSVGLFGTLVAGYMYREAK